MRVGRALAGMAMVACLLSSCGGPRSWNSWCEAHDGFEAAQGDTPAEGAKRVADAAAEMAKTAPGSVRAASERIDRQIKALQAAQAAPGDASLEQAEDNATSYFRGAGSLGKFDADVEAVRNAAARNC